MKLFNNGISILSLDQDLDAYITIIDKIKRKSVYFLPSYLKTVQIVEGYSVNVICLYNKDKIAMLPFVKRRVNDLPLFNGLKKEIWDIVSPYEYSCVVTNVEEKSERYALIKELHIFLNDYCEREQVVSGFARFDPFLTDISAFTLFYNTRKNCDNVYIDLCKSSKEIERDFHSSVKKNIKRALNNGLVFSEEDKNRENIDLFIKMYMTNMKRLNAEKYFYFSAEYFKILIGQCEGSVLFFVRDKCDKLLAASILLYDTEVAYHHLTGYDLDARLQRPNDFMIFNLINWTQNKGLSSFHLGGGSKSIHDFKSKFSGTNIPYYVGTKIYNPKLYQELCDLWQRRNSPCKSNNYFPLYRFDPKSYDPN